MIPGHADGSVHWALYRDATCLDACCVVSGSLPLYLVRSPKPQSVQESPPVRVSHSTSFSLGTTGIQLVPQVQRRIWELLEQEQATGARTEDASMDIWSNVFPIAVEDLTIGSKAAELGLQEDKTTPLYCKLQLEAPATETQTEGQDADWFVWKLRRAANYRVRGNEAFKEEKYGAAVKLYKRALAWLEPPNDRAEATLDTMIQYSAEELQQVNFVATACYANLASCYSKLNGDGDVKRCIAAATSALKLEDGHTKARYRRSQAYVASKEFDLALADLTKLRDLEPNSKLFRSAFSRAQSAKTQLRKKQQSAFANIFEK